MWLDCIPCILRVALYAIRQSTTNPETERLLFTEAIKITTTKPLSTTPPEVISDILIKINDLTGCNDPFRDVRERLNRDAMRLYLPLKKQISGSLYLATKMAIAANSSDVMTKPELIIHKNKEIPKINFLKFKEEIKDANLILYLGDNAGEIVFDRLLIEEILRQKDTNIIYVVRGHPSLNDVTIEDAINVGINKIVEVIENGIKLPLPGTQIGRVSKKLLKLFEEADLVISKGGGNFETLMDEDIKNKTFFMLISKCKPLSDFFGTDLDSLILHKF